MTSSQTSIMWTTEHTERKKKKKGLLSKRKALFNKLGSLANKEEHRQNLGLMMDAR